MISGKTSPSFYLRRAVNLPRPREGRLGMQRNQTTMSLDAALGYFPSPGRKQLSATPALRLFGEAQDLPDLRPLQDASVFEQAEFGNLAQVGAANLGAHRRARRGFRRRGRAGYFDFAHGYDQGRAGSPGHPA